MRYAGRGLVVMVAAAALACGDGAGPGDEGREVDLTPLQTDRTDYFLSYTPDMGIYWLDMTVTFTNRGSGWLYLHRTCGHGDAPQRVVRRVDDSGARTWLGDVTCITAVLRLPIPVGPGETFVDRFTLYSTESPNANPPITMDQRTGTFRLEYFIQTENRVEGWAAVALVPEARRVTNAFRVTR
jgi:hypothetical protein